MGSSQHEGTHTGRRCEDPHVFKMTSAVAHRVGYVLLEARRIGGGGEKERGQELLRYLICEYLIRVLPSLDNRRAPPLPWDVERQ